MQESLSRFVAKVVGNEREHDHAKDVGGEGDWHDENGEGEVAEQGVVANDVEVEQAQRFEREEGVQAGAGVGDQQFILADLQDDTGAGDRVAYPEEDVLGSVGDSHLHRHGDGVDDGARQRNHEEHEEEGEPLCLESGGAAREQEDGGKQPDDGANFEDEDVL